MAVVLAGENAKEWSYRGEGAVNLVLAYSGESPSFVGKVLRIQKVPRNVSECENGHSGLTRLECHLWRNVNELVSAPSREIADHIFVRLVMCPLLGSRYVDAGIRIPVSREFLEAVEKNVLHQRPSWRVDAAKVNLLSDSAMLISDHSVFPHGTLKEEFCLSVEIKPKCGFLPHSKFIAESNAVKRRITRFRMHQALKSHQGKVFFASSIISTRYNALPETFLFRNSVDSELFLGFMFSISHLNPCFRVSVPISHTSMCFLPSLYQISYISGYDPLDFFSGSKDRLHKAIRDLFMTPQNNFRVFLNGCLILGGLGGVADTTSSKVGQAFDDALKDKILAGEGMRTECFLELVSEAVLSSGLPAQILEVQKLDNFDIEGAIHAYYDVVSQPCKICKELGDHLSKRFTALHSMSMEDSLKIVRDYLIAATAKDLSMMISFRPRIDGNRESAYSFVSLKSTNQNFDYKASCIDLDLKPLERMKYYYELDQKIVSCYKDGES